MKKIVLLVALFSITACNKRGADPKTDVQKASYAIGQQIGREMKGQGVEIDVDALATSIQDVLSDKQSRLSIPEMQQAMMAMRDKMMAKQTAAGKDNKEKGDKFLAENKKKPGVKVVDGGLQYEVITEGKGKKPKDTDIVKVHYRGTLIDGTEFDSSYKRNEPAQFPLKGVIPGWTKALQMMPVGSKWKLTIPSDLAYGPAGRPGIPPNSVLQFDVELLEIVKPK